MHTASKHRMALAIHIIKIICEQPDSVYQLLKVGVAIPLHFQLRMFYPLSHCTVLQMNNSVSSTFAINPVTMEIVSNVHVP